MLTRRHLTILIGAAALLGYTDVAHADEIYVPLVSKGFQHQFWQAVKAGAEQAAKQYNVKITFEGPETEAMVDKQIDMLTAALAKKPSAIGFAALDSKAAIPLLKKAQEAKIPVIAFDSGKRQKDAILSGEMAGAITQNPVGIGFKTVEAAVRALKGETLPKIIDTGFYYYDKSNISDPKIAAVLYD